MTKLEWDKINERPYETGIDRGVFYIPNALGIYDNGVAWNGLTSIKEEFPDDKTRPHYFDGVKYLDSYNIGDFSARLSAFTYPDEFVEFEGVGPLGNGLFVDDQSPKVFGLSYRTMLEEDKYKIHLLYNLTAVPDDITYQNESNPSAPILFTWSINSVPEKATPYRATAHAILESTVLPGSILTEFEDILYGTDNTNPRLPSLETLVSLILGWDPRLIVPHTDTGLAELITGVGDLTETKQAGIYYALPTTKLVETSIPGIYELEIV